MVRIRQARQVIVRGRYEARPDDDSIPPEIYAELFPVVEKTTAEQWAEGFVLSVLTQRVAQAREEGLSIEEIQNGQAS